MTKHRLIGKILLQNNLDCIRIAVTTKISIKNKIIRYKIWTFQTDYKIIINIVRMFSNHKKKNNITKTVDFLLHWFFINSVFETVELINQATGVAGMP